MKLDQCVKNSHRYSQGGSTTNRIGKGMLVLQDHVPGCISFVRHCENGMLGVNNAYLLSRSKNWLGGNIDMQRSQYREFTARTFVAPLYRLGEGQNSKETPKVNNTSLKINKSSLRSLKRPHVDPWPFASHNPKVRVSLNSRKLLTADPAF